MIVPVERRVRENITMYTEHVPESMWRDAHTISTKVWEGETVVPEIHFDGATRILAIDAVYGRVWAARTAR